MASIRADHLRDANPGRQGRGRYTDELWEVWASKDDQTNPAESNYNENGYVDPINALDTPGLPQVYAPHPKIPEALCVDARVVQVISNWSVIVRLRFQSWDLYTGGPRPVVEGQTQAYSLPLPCWVKVVDQVQNIVGYELRRPSYPHKVALRVETRFVPGNQFDAVQTAIANNVGAFYTIGQTLYRLSDRCSAVYDGRSYTRVTYVFERPQTVPAIPVDANHSRFGNDIAIPALPPFYTYAPLADNPPKVNVVQPLEGNGAALPGFP
jgi:hypothetical protein